MKRLGPELKMPDLKVPPVLADVYYDLRERRLLPVVALVAVAIAATPFLLAGSEESAPAETPEQAAESVRLEAADDTALTVVEAKPGLRDYRKRLRDRTPTDPFRQLHTGVPETSKLKSVGVSSGGAGSASASAETSTPASGETDPGGGAVGSPSPGGSADAGGKTGTSGSTRPGGSDSPDDLDGKRLYGFRPDVRFGVAGSGDLKLHEDLPLGSLLPKKNAVVLFIGVTHDGKRALFSIAPEVLVRGDGGCVGGNENCRFLSLREGDAVDLVTGVPGKAYRLKVESIDFVELDLPPKSERAEGSSAKGARPGMTPGLPQNFSN